MRGGRETAGACAEAATKRAEAATKRAEVDGTRRRRSGGGGASGGGRDAAASRGVVGESGERARWGGNVGCDTCFCFFSS